MKKRSTQLILFLLISIFLFRIQLLAKVADTTFTRGIWMYESDISKQGSKNVVAKLKDNYINKVYLLVKGGGGRLISAETLSEFITDAHSEGIEIHFWYIIGDDEEFLSAHPDAHQYHCPKPAKGFTSSYPDSSSHVNYLYPGYKDYVLDKINYFLTNFKCDGIHLDVIRFTNLTYSFDKYSLQKADSLGVNTKRLVNLFNQDYDFYAPKGGVIKGGFVNLFTAGDADVVKWVNMRNNIIYDYIKSIKTLIQQVKPGLALTAAFMPEAAVQPNLANVYYAQDYSLNSSLLDMISPMSYFKSFNEPTSWLKTITQGAIKQVDPKCKIYAGAQTFDGTTPEQLKEEINYSVEGGAAGIIIFRYGTTTDDQWKVVKEVFGKIAHKQ